jgi:hypothetical protein
VATPTPAPTPEAPPAEHLQASFEATVPAAWRADITVQLESIDGSTSWGWPTGLIQVGTAHLTRGEDTLRTTLAHEFGHLIAYAYVSQAFHGAAPAGWPAYGNEPAEAWADCVARAFTGVDLPSHGLPSCAGGCAVVGRDLAGRRTERPPARCVSRRRQLTSARRATGRPPAPGR